MRNEQTKVGSSAVCVQEYGKEANSIRKNETAAFAPLNVLHNADTTSVTPPRDHAHVANLELDGIDRLARLDVHLDCVIHLHMADGSMKRDQFSKYNMIKNCTETS